LEKIVTLIYLSSYPKLEEPNQKWQGFCLKESQVAKQTCMDSVRERFLEIKKEQKQLKHGRLQLVTSQQLTEQKQ
jgi:hypothetical protein